MWPWPIGLHQIYQPKMLLQCFLLFFRTTKNSNNTFMDSYLNIGQPYCNRCKTMVNYTTFLALFSYTICYLLGNYLVVVTSKLNMILYMLTRLCVFPVPLFHSTNIFLFFLTTCVLTKWVPFNYKQLVFSFHTSTYLTFNIM